MESKSQSDDLLDRLAARTWHKGKRRRAGYKPKSVRRQMLELEERLARQRLTR